MIQNTLSHIWAVVREPAKRLGAFLLKIGIELPTAYGIAAGIELLIIGYVSVPQELLKVPGYADTFRTLIFLIVITKGFCWSVPKSWYLAGEP